MVAKQGTWYFAVGALLCVYVGLRWLTLTQVGHFEDNDSAFYLVHMDLIRTGGWREILHIDSTVSLLYVFVGAGISALGFPTELAGRLVSLLASVGLFFIALGLAQRFMSRQASLFALLLLALNPVLVGLSVAALTEPLYTSLVYTGVLVFVLRHQSLSLWWANIMGLLFGLAFLTRLEGIVFLIFIPLVQTLYLLMTEKLRTEAGRHLLWSLVFAVAFLLVGAVKISLTSYNMGTLALDGRQVWSKAQNQPGDNRSHDEKIYGLDFSPSMVNIKYLERNPEALSTPVKVLGGERWKGKIRRILGNLNLLYEQRLPQLVGLGALTFFAFGLVVLYRHGRVFEIVFVVLFLAAALSAPLQARNFTIRIVLVSAPIILILAGIGLHSATQFFLRNMGGRRAVRWGAVLAVYGLLFSIWLVPLVSTLVNPVRSWGYDPAVMEHLVDLIREDNDGQEEVRVAAKWGFLGFFAQSRRYFVPYGEYEALVEYLRLNEIQYLYLEDRALGDWPFMGAFSGERYKRDFVLMHQTVERDGQKAALYKFLSR